MTSFELVLNILVKVITIAISKQRKLETIEKSKKIAKKGGAVDKLARTGIQARLEKTVISPLITSEKWHLKAPDDK